mmetsp:Transcript_14173/g.18569  ORF Transcript_14173/g.18569 Transcript_14173/m.18569 type:complete len:89 (+) Transcript_14173:273-539(+)
MNGCTFGVTFEQAALTQGKLFPSLADIVQDNEICPSKISTALTHPPDSYKDRNETFAVAVLKVLRGDRLDNCERVTHNVFVHFGELNH